MDYRTHIIIALTICFIVACFIVEGINTSYTKRLITAIEKDYCESTVIGYHGVVWQKCKEEK